jgi:hypothetical protein
MIDLKVFLSITHKEQSVRAVIVAVLGQLYISASSPKGVPSAIVLQSLTDPSGLETLTSACPFSRTK